MKSTSLIGGASIISILIGMVRTKFVAVLLGPSGVGLMGMLNGILGMFATLSGMGIGTSGVRAIAEQNGRGNVTELSQVVRSLRRTVWGTGLLGALLIAVLSPWLSKWTFGNNDYTLSIALLGMTILFGNIALGQSCVIRGTRRIADLAKINILGAFNSTLIGIPLYYFFGTRGIVPSLILGSLAALLTSWHFARRVRIESCSADRKTSFKITKDLLKFGFPLMLTGLMSASVFYFIRMILLKRFDLQGIGIYTASFAVSSILIDFVLTAMGADYYPRLAAAANDRSQIKNEVDSQSEIALLLAVPALMLTILFAPAVIWLFYSGNFEPAADILRWSVFGVFGRIVSWPLGFVVLAKGKGKTFFFCELTMHLFHLSALWICTNVWGLVGAGVAFALLYLFYTLLMLAVYYILTNNKWRLSYFLQMILFLFLLSTVNILSFFVSLPWLSWTISLLILLSTSLYCIFRLSKKTGIGFREIKQRIYKA